MKKYLGLFILLSTITAIGLLSESLATVEQELSPDDPIFTYKVDMEEPHWFGWNSDGTKIYPEEFLRDNPDASENDIERAKHKRLLNSFNGLPWNQAVLSGIENGVLTHDDNAKHLCRFVSGAWQKKSWSYDAFLKRVKTQMNMIGAKPYMNPVITDEYIAYYFKTGNANFLVGKKNDLHLIPRFYYNTLRKDLREVTDENLRSYREKMRDHLKNSIEITGVGKTESMLTSSFLIEKKDYEDDTIVVYIPVTKKGFMGFYESSEAQKPPQYFIDLLEGFIKWKRSVSDEGFALKTASRSYYSKERVDYMQDKRLKNLDTYYNYELDFIKSERMVRFEYDFSRPSGIKNNVNRPDWLIGFNLLSEYPESGDINNINVNVGCYRTVLSSSKFDMEKLGKPYFMEVPYQKVKRCRPYMNWFECHIRNRKTSAQCRDVAIEEPEICTP